MARFLYRIGAFSYRRHWLVLGAWLAILVAVATLGLAFKSPTNDTFSVPGTESQRALSLLDQKFPGTGGAVARIVFVAPPGHRLNERRYAELVTPTVEAARRVPHTVGGSQAFLGSVQRSPDMRVAFADLHFAVPVADITPGTKAALQRVAQPARAAGLDVEYSGGVISTAQSGSSADTIGIAIAFLVLMMTFTALLAAAVPLLTAALGIGVGLLGLDAVTGLVTINSSAPTLALMLGLAVGIDYATFLISRTRQNLHEGMSLDEAVPHATGTAGSAVTFAGVTVIIALVGLSVVGIPFLRVMGLAAAATVTVAVLIAVTLLPAALAVVGTRIAAQWRTPKHPTFGHRYASFITARPWLSIGAVVLIIATAAIPALHLRQTLPGDKMQPTSTTERRAYDLLTQGFGEGANGPLTIVVDATGTRYGPAAGADAARLLRTLPNVQSVTAPLTNQPGQISIVQVTPKTGPATTATKDLVKLIRKRAGIVHHRYGVATYVTGQTAVNIDTSDKLTSALPVFLALIVGLALLLLIVVFRSILVPVVAAGGFLLSVAAALGLTTFVFQGHHGASLVGVDGPTPIVSFVPVLMVAILFGLAMDYEVFLVSRMREAYTHGADPTFATVSGFSASARVVTAAALIMVVVFGAFLSDPSIVIKQIAFALAVGIVVDAFLIRMTLIPAVHRLLGHAGWWLPSRLEQGLPNLDIEGEQLERSLGAAANRSNN